MRRASACRWLRRGKEPGVVVTEVDPYEPCRRFRLQAGRRDSRSRGQDRGHAGRGAPAPSRRPLRRQAQRAAAREVGAKGRGSWPFRSAALERARPRSAPGRAADRDRAVTSAFVAPAGGANPGDGRHSPSPLIPSLCTGIRRPRRARGWSRGGGAIRRPPRFGLLGRRRRTVFARLAVPGAFAEQAPVPIGRDCRSAREVPTRDARQTDRHAPADRRGRPRRRRLPRPSLPRGRPCRRPWRRTARRAWRSPSTGDYDVLIVDRMLPKRDGLSVIGELRDQGRSRRRC